MATITHTLESVRAALAAEYEVVGELGSGGMAVVYLGRQRHPSRSVAIKVMNPAVPSASARGRFLREIELAGQLSHPHIVPIFAAGEVGELLYYVMPYIEGESLRKRLERAPALTLEATLHIVRDVAEALAYAHARGIIHRDIKPENILISEGHAVVADFGLARACDACGFARLTIPDVAMGTPRYMSLEQAIGSESVDERTDIYSLGCVLYEMLVGEPPTTWPDPPAAKSGRMTDVPPEHRRALDAAPRELEGVLVRALAMAPQDRFPSAAEFMRSLGRAGAGPDAVRRLLRRVARAFAALGATLPAGITLLLWP